MRNTVKIFAAAILFVLGFVACSTPAQDLSSQPVSSEIPDVQQQVEAICGTDYTQFENDRFVFYSGTGTAVHNRDTDSLSSYVFCCSYKSGIYKIELYCENDSTTGRHIAVRKEDGNITDAVPFTLPGVYGNFGLYGTVGSAFDRKLNVGTMYCQHTGATLNIDFLTDTITSEKLEILDIGEDYSHIATREDGRFSLYWRSIEAYTEEYRLSDNITGQITQLGSDLSPYASFLPDGNIGVMNMSDYIIMSTEGEKLFALSDSFPLGVTEDGKARILCGVMKNEIDNTYIIVYLDMNSGEYVQDTDLLKDTYKLSVLDSAGKEIKTFETGKYGETYKNYSERVSIKAVNEHTISFYKETMNSTDYEVFVDLNTGAVKIMDYRQW